MTPKTRALIHTTIGTQSLIEVASLLDRFVKAPDDVPTRDQQLLLQSAQALLSAVNRQLALAEGALGDPVAAETKPARPPLGPSRN